MISSINGLKFADLLGNLTSLCGPKNCVEMFGILVYGYAL